MKHLLIFMLAFFVNPAFATSPLIWGSPYPLLLGLGGQQFQNSDTTTTCNSAAQGSLRNNANTLQWCDGTSWTSLGGAGGTVPISSGGTGQTTANAAFNALAPSQGGNSGLFLTTNGTNTSWASAGGGAALSGITAATGANTINNVANAQEWDWNSQTSGTAMLFSTSGTGFTGNLVQMQATGNNNGSTGNILALTATGASNKASNLSITNASNVSNGGVSGITVTMSATGANPTGISDSCASTATTERCLDVEVATGGTASGTGIAIYASTGGTSNGNSRGGAGTGVSNSYSLAGEFAAPGSGMRDALRVENTASSANGNGSNILFSAENNNSPNRIIAAAAVGGIMTDVTAGAENGALAFQTTNNHTLREVGRFDTSGYFGIGTTSPAGILDVEGGTASGSNAGTAINIVSQTGATGHAGGNIVMTTGAATTADSGQFNVTTGNTAFDTSSGEGTGGINLTTGNNSVVSTQVGFNAQLTGSISLLTGNITTNQTVAPGDEPNTGNIVLQTGDAQVNKAFSGNINLTTGAAKTGTGSVTLSTGNAVAASNGSSGGVTINPGAKDGTGTRGKIALFGHTVFSGPAPTIGSGSGDCGTSPSVDGNDMAGRITVGSSTNGGVCTVTFSDSSWPVAPACFANDETSSVAVRVSNVSTSSFKINGVFVAGNKVTYTCFAWE
jgi:hypothetical protein